MTEPVFKLPPQKRIPPIWCFKVLAFFGLAKRRVSIDPEPDYVGGPWSRVEMYRVFGKYYLTKIEYIEHWQVMETRFFR